MTLVTLSGVISAANVNTNFNDKLSALNSVNQASASPKSFSYDIRNVRASGTGLLAATDVGFRCKEFTPPDDLYLTTIGLSFVNGTAVSRTITLTLDVYYDTTDTSYTADKIESLQRYLSNQTVTVSATGASAATEYTATRYTPTVPIVLVKGVMYRMTLSSSSATAIASAYGCVYAKQLRRYR